MKKNKKKYVIIALLLFIVVGGVYKYLNRYDTKPKDVFVENEKLERIINDVFISDAYELVNIDYIKSNYNLLNTEKMNISYGEPNMLTVETYGNKGNIFKFIIAPTKTLLFYFDLKKRSLDIDGIGIGDNYLDIKKYFNLERNEVYNFSVSPIEGEPIVEFYFNKEGLLEELIFKNPYIH